MTRYQAITKALPWIATAIIAVVAGWQWLRVGNDFWSRADRRAQRLLTSGDAKSAADEFADPFWRGVALYRAGDFQTAKATFAGLMGSDAKFNQANACVMLGDYTKAVELYDQLLVVAPDRLDARVNREIAIGRANRLNDQGGEMTGGMLGADEVVINTGPAKDGEQVEVQQQELSDKETRSLWLRQIETTPADFLRTKFAYQNAKQTNQREEPIVDSNR